MAKKQTQTKQLTDAEQEIYKRFIDWMRQTWWDLPEAEELLPMMMTLYTPEEAAFLTGMPFGGKGLDELSQLKQMEPEKLQKKLDSLAKKGLVFRSVKGDNIRYSLNDGFFIQRSTFWPGRTDARTKTMASIANRYFFHGFMDQSAYSEQKGLRVLPIEKTVKDAKEILPYEEVVKVLDSQDYFAVATCPCKHKKNLAPDTPNCTYPTEVCLHFGRLAHYMVENELGREITRKQAEDVLRLSAESGLVHAISNHQEGVDTICNCCKCCCIFFEAYYKLNHSTSLTPSNYQIHTNTETCIGCGLCVKRCPMEALHLEDFPQAKGRITLMTGGNGKERTELRNKTGKVSVVNTDLCIGCGVCAYKCSTKSLVLERREPVQHPPKTGRDYFMQYMADRQAGVAHLRKP